MPPPCATRGCRSRSSTWATSTSRPAASRWRPQSSSTPRSSRRWRASRRWARKWRRARCRPTRRSASTRCARASSPAKFGASAGVGRKGAMHQLLLSGIAALVGGVAAVERKGAFQLMLSRPLVVAPVMGALLGDAQGGLLLGVPLELLFLGGVNLGGNLPDNETLLAAALTAMVVPAGIAMHSGVDAPLA